MSYQSATQHSNSICDGLSAFISSLSQVLPKARINFSPEKQRELLYKSLCVMPLKLLERVLPWFVKKLNDVEAVSFLQNIRLAGYLYLLSSFFFNKYCPTSH